MARVWLRLWLVLATTTELRAQQPSGTLEVLREAARRDSNDALAHYQLALGYFHAKLGDSAVRALRTAIAVDPQLAVAYALLGRLLIQAELRDIFVPQAASVQERSAARDSIGQAQRMLRTAWLLDPMVEYSRPNLYAFPARWRGTLQRAFSHLEKQHLDQARQDFGAVFRGTRRDPGAIPVIALWYHTLITFELGMVDSAIADCEIMLDEAMRRGTGYRPGEMPLPNEIEYVLAHLHQRAGHLPEAERLYLRVLERDFGVYQALSELARVYEAQGRWNEAIAARRSAVDVNPEDPSLVFDLGVTLADAGRDSLAAETLRAAIAANPRETRAWYGLGIVTARLNRFEEAQTALEQFLALAPSRYTAQREDARARLQSMPH